MRSSGTEKRIPPVHWVNDQPLHPRLGLDPAAMMTMAAAVPWIVVDLVLGLALVFTYAAMRPRFGPGPKTAVISALVLGVAISAVVGGFSSMGLMSMSALARGFLASQINMTIATVAGAALYSES
jgi:hypothetical protein